MSRRRTPAKRTILPDPKYGDKVIAKFINIVMTAGKKSVAERIVYGALQIVSEKGHESELEAFKEALSNVEPKVEVKSRRVGGATYQVPVEVRPDRRLALAMRWFSQLQLLRTGNWSARIIGSGGVANSAARII